MTTDGSHEFTHGDVALVAWLRYCGCDPIGLQLEGRDFAVWLFTESDELLDLVEQYNTKEANVEPSRYSILIRELYRDLNDFRFPKKVANSRRHRSA